MRYLRQFIAHDASDERHEMEAKIMQAERDERCVRRAVRLMALLGALALVGLGYSAVLMEDYPQNVPRFFTHLVVRVSCVLGVASLISFLAFAGVWGFYRQDLAKRRDECRRLAAKILEARMGPAGAQPLPAPAQPPAAPRSSPEPDVSRKPGRGADEPGLELTQS